MFRRILIITGVLLSLAGTAEAGEKAESDDDIHRVMTCNIRITGLEADASYSERGWENRRDLCVETILSRRPDIICLVDNCYGEFVERIEPSEFGADMIVGSLIKNPGGGLAPCGGYIAGTKECVEQAAYRLSSPGLGKEVGATLGVIQSFYLGLFLAPTVVAGALKGAIFAANAYEKLGYKVIPDSTESRHDIIQAVELNTQKALIVFCFV